MQQDKHPLVAIKCLVFNHEPYLRDCLNGFVMQQTDFPFVAIVHDDASTDHSADIIREYAAKYPDIIRPIYETENQYSKSDGSLGRIMNAAVDATGAKYIALCEGDDYWTDPHKLQKQVSFLETHQEYSLCCHRYRIYNQNEQTWEDDYVADYFAGGKNPDGFAFTKHINLFDCWITKTNTLLYRRGLFDWNILARYHYSRDVHNVYHLLSCGMGYCLPFVGAVYRRQDSGIFSSLTKEQQYRQSFLIYAELFQNNLQDEDLVTFFENFSRNYFDNLRVRIQQRQWNVLLLKDMVDFMRNAPQSFTTTFIIRKFLHSMWYSVTT